MPAPPASAAAQADHSLLNTAISAEPGEDLVRWHVDRSAALAHDPHVRALYRPLAQRCVWAFDLSWHSALYRRSCGVTSS